MHADDVPAGQRPGKPPRRQQGCAGQGPWQGCAGRGHGRAVLGGAMARLCWEGPWQEPRLGLSMHCFPEYLENMKNKGLCIHLKNIIDMDR